MNSEKRQEMKKKLAIIPVALLLVYGGVATAEKTGKCPISGKAANPKISIEVNGKAVGFCCNNCKKSWNATLHSFCMYNYLLCSFF